MKKSFKSTLALVLSLVFIFSFSSCSRKNDTPSIWKDAIYLEDTELGEGATTIKVEVKAEDRSVIFTIHTDARDLFGALSKHNLVDGEFRNSRTYVSTVNGITANFETDKSYWGLWKNGTEFLPGIDCSISDGGYYLLLYTK